MELKNYFATLCITIGGYETLSYCYVSALNHDDAAKRIDKEYNDDNDEHITEIYSITKISDHELTLLKKFI
jgi:hypothetical protein